MVNRGVQNIAHKVVQGQNRLVMEKNNSRKKNTKHFSLEETVLYGYGKNRRLNSPGLK